MLTVTIPGGSPVAAAGYVNITFTPATAAVKDDSEIVFLANGSRTIPVQRERGRDDGVAERAELGGVSDGNYGGHAHVHIDDGGGDDGARR